MIFDANISFHIENFHFSDEDDAVQEIASMPGVARYGINKLRDALKPLVEKGLKTVLVFGVPGNIMKVR